MEVRQQVVDGLLAHLTYFCYFVAALSSYACNNGLESGAQNLRQSFLTYDESGSIKDFGTQEIRYTADETEYSFFDSRRGGVTKIREVRTGQNTLHYLDNELESIETPGEKPGCIYKRHFSKEWFGEEQICNGDRVQGTFFNSENTHETRCVHGSGGRRCQILENGIARWDFLLEEDFDLNTIRYTDILSHRMPTEENTHITRKEKFSVGKTIIEREFSTFIPFGAQTPGNSDSKWKLNSRVESEDFMPGVNMYRHVRLYDTNGFMHAEILTEPVR